MEETKHLHNLILKERKYLSISGVSDVDTFDEEKIILFTEDETLEIEGVNLHIQKLDVATGDLIIEGEIDSIIYTGNRNGGTKKGFFTKLIK